MNALAALTAAVLSVTGPRVLSVAARGAAESKNLFTPTAGARAPHATRAAKAKLKAPAAPSFVVVLDPGHGGDQDGAVSPDGVKEKDLTLQIVQRVGAVLRKRGVRVILTRTGDLTVPLANRPAIANAIQADLFISVHLNSMATAEQRAAMTGIETYILSAGATDERASAVAARENADRIAGEDPLDPADPVAAILSDLSDQDSLAASQRFAADLQERLVAAEGTGGHGVKQAPFYVLAGARMPAVLVELGFVSHPEESKLVATRGYQDRAAEAIAEAVVAYRAEAARLRR